MGRRRAALATGLRGQGSHIGGACFTDSCITVCVPVELRIGATDETGVATSSGRGPHLCWSSAGSVIEKEFITFLLCKPWPSSPAGTTVLWPLIGHAASLSSRGSSSPAERFCLSRTPASLMYGFDYHFNKLHFRNSQKQIVIVSFNTCSYVFACFE